MLCAPHMFSPCLRFRPDDQIPLADQPMMKLIRRILAVRLADCPQGLMRLRAVLLSLKLQLDGTLDVLAEFPSLVLSISAHRHDLSGYTPGRWSVKEKEANAHSPIYPGA